MVSDKRTARIVGALILIAYIVIFSAIFDSPAATLVFDLITGAAVIAMAVLLYPVFKPVQGSLAILYSGIKGIDGIVICAAAFFPILGFAELHTHVYTYDIYLFATGFLILSYLFYRSRLIPRFIPVWGMIGSVLMLVSVAVTMIMQNQLIPEYISHLPVIANELVLAVWLIVKGFSPAASKKK